MRYYDHSNILAHWDQASLQGLGAMLYTDTSKFGAPYRHTPPLQELGAGVLASEGLGSLGATVSYPWMSYSRDTEELQKAVNEALEAQGYCPIKADGKLGAGTCGAIRTMLSITGQTDQSPPSTCLSFTNPSRPPCPDGTVPRGSGPGLLSGDMGWIVGGGLFAAAAIGAAIYVKKKRR